MRAVIAVTNDVSTDQRVIRSALTLQKLQVGVTLIGRRYPGHTYTKDPRFAIVRFRMIFRRGPLFYAAFNLRLLCRLLFQKADLMIANDLDTLPAVYLVSLIRGKVLVYDSHEYFTEVPELIGRKKVQRIWENIESWILPHIRFASTVSVSIARAYRDKYGLTLEVIRNLPAGTERVLPNMEKLRKGSEKIVLYQGSLNKGRGLEKVIRAMPFCPACRLVIIGRGDVEANLKQLVLSLGVQEQVTFTGRILPENLPAYTRQADLGISLEEDLGLSYRFSLPNKVFDYIRAGIPVLVSDLPEMRDLVEHYGIGRICATDKPEKLGVLLHDMTTNEQERAIWKANLITAATELCWEKEEEKLIRLYRRALFQVPFSEKQEDQVQEQG